jgi:predicted metal-dependent hydrolase
MSESETGAVCFGSTEIHYRVVRSTRRQKTIALSLGEQGLTVLAPVRTPSEVVEALVKKRGAWIVAKQAQLAEQLAQRDPPKALRSGETLTYLGRQYRLKRVADLPRARMWGRYIQVPEGTPEEVYDFLLGWYRNRAEEKLLARVAHYTPKLNHYPTKVLICGQKRRWGSCNAKGELRLNWRIIMAPLSLIDYVVVHELVHLEHLNHSKAYWQRLGELLPDYKARQKQLDSLGIRFTLI